MAFANQRGPALAGCPPLPHWLVISMMKIFGRDNAVWIVRLPSACMGTATVLLTLYIARKWFGPAVGIVSAMLLATSFKFYQYACLAEDDIYLAAMVTLAAALFTHAELSTSKAEFGLKRFFTWRPPAILGFFAVLGFSNLTKGPLLGLLILGSAVGAYLVCRAFIEKSSQPILRYTWLWGWVLLLALTFAWPLWAYHKYPDVLDNFKYDYLGRMSGTYSAINQPWWYYPPKLFAGLLPWAPFCLFGVTIAWRMATRSYTSASDAEFESKPADAVGSQRNGPLWILCWALAPLLVLSIPKGKHDHYLVPFLAPWAVLGAFGLLEVVRLMRLSPRKFKNAGVATFLVMLAGYCAGEALFAARTDHTIDDTAFLLRCQKEVPDNVPLFIDGKLGPPGNLDFFRIQFYSCADAVLLHNLTFLRSQSITSPIVYVIARQGDGKLLEQLGNVQAIDQSPRSHEIETPAGRFTLFKVIFNPHLQRYPTPPYVTSLQAMERAPGPWCGPPFNIVGAAQ